MRLIIILLFLPFSIFSSLEGMECHRWDRSAVKPYCRQVLRENNWRLTGEGSSFSTNSDGIREEAISLGFHGSQYLTLDQARQLFVRQTEKLIFLMNKARRKRPRPFSSRDLEYSITFSDSPCQYHLPPYVAEVSLVSNYIVYRHYDSVSDRVDTFYREPYPEAVRIVEEETQRMCVKPF